jgi:hypothetical protein
MSEFKSTATVAGDQLSLALEGLIDEDVVFPTVDLTGMKKIVIDLKGIKTINSVGIREWLNWIRPIGEKVEIVLQKAPKAMVFQFNMVEGFLPPRATVASFYVPYFCERCDREDNVLFTIGQEIKVEGGQVKSEFKPKSAGLCEQADCELEMDVTEGKYFQFLKKA